MRELFNAGRFVERAERGELLLRPYPRRKSSVTPLHRGQPAGTLSQLVDYWDGDAVVARAFQYLRPDGSIGASGRPDPKVLVMEAEVLLADDVPGHWCERCGGPCTAVPVA
jgi:hypothetical protein